MSHLARWLGCRSPDQGAQHPAASNDTSQRPVEGGVPLSFLPKFDALAPDDHAGRARLFMGALRANWRALFAELRQHRPILNIAPFAVVTRWSDVVDVLSRPGTFGVTYAGSMDPSVGPFMLGHDNTELNWRDKSVMRALLRWDDLRGIRDLAGRTAAAALSARSDAHSVDIAKTVSRLVPLRVVQQSFGFPGPDDATMLRWSKHTQTDMFHNFTGDATVHNNNLTAGREMREWIRGFLAKCQPWPQRTGNDTVSRLLRLTSSELSGLDTEGVVSNVCGLLVGAIETTSQAIVSATEQILLRPEVAAEAIKAAVADDAAKLDPIVWEALRFNPITTFVLRGASEAATLAPGTPYAHAVPPGRKVAAATGSAMFDPGVFAEPDTFRARPREAYLHLGFGSHECLGKYVAFEIIPETVRQILLLPGIHLLPSEGSRIDNGGGPFAEKFVVGLT